MRHLPPNRQDTGGFEPRPARTAALARSRGGLRRHREARMVHVRPGEDRLQQPYLRNAAEGPASVDGETLRRQREPWEHRTGRRDFPRDDSAEAAWRYDAAKRDRIACKTACAVIPKSAYQNEG